MMAPPRIRAWAQQDAVESGVAVDLTCDNYEVLASVGYTPAQIESQKIRQQEAKKRAESERRKEADKAAA